MVVIYPGFLMQTSGKFITLKRGITAEGRSFLQDSLKDYGPQDSKGRGFS